MVLAIFRPGKIWLYLLFPAGSVVARSRHFMALFDNSADFHNDFSVREAHNEGGNDQDNDQEINFLKET